MTAHFGLAYNGTSHYLKTRYQILVLVNIEIPLTLQINYAQDLEH
ncbi:hypothetical protein [Nostoc sp. C052]|nr:hypothetical protein [Nostoc sp. C052]